MRNLGIVYILNELLNYCQPIHSYTHSNVTKNQNVQAQPGQKNWEIERSYSDEYASLQSDARNALKIMYKKEEIAEEDEDETDSD